MTMKSSGRLFSSRLGRQPCSDLRSWSASQPASRRLRRSVRTLRENGPSISKLCQAALLSSLVSIPACATVGWERIVVDDGMPLIPQLPGGTRPLIVASAAMVDVAVPVDGTPAAAIALAALGADVILVGRVQSVDGHLRADGTWIDTSISVLNEQLIKGNAPPSSAVTFGHNGGEVRINGRRVKTENRAVLNPDGRYLLFLDARSDKTLALQGAWRVRQDETLGGVGERTRNEPLLGGMKLAEVIQEVRRQLK
jgi:hypothetical protein